MEANNDNNNTISMFLSRLNNYYIAEEIKEMENIVKSIRHLFITEEDEDNLCVVCYSNLPDITFYPCNHDNCCEACYLQLRTPKTCPYCRTRIVSTEDNFENEPDSESYDYTEEELDEMKRLMIEHDF